MDIRFLKLSCPSRQVSVRLPFFHSHSESPPIIIYFLLSSIINGISPKRRHSFHAISLPALPLPSWNVFFVNTETYSHSFSDRDPLTLYHENDLVLFKDKVYSAKGETMGEIPSLNEKRICKADLTYLNSPNETGKYSLFAETTDNKRYYIKIPVLEYNGTTGKTQL